MLVKSKKIGGKKETMKKTLSFFVFLLMVFSGLEAVALGGMIDEKNTGFVTKEISLEINIPKPVFKINDGYVEIYLRDINSFIFKPGEPLLPKIVKKIDLPIGTREIAVKVTPTNINEYVTTKKINPAPPLLPLVDETQTVQTFLDKKIYNKDEKYPSSWCNYFVKCGLNENNVLTTQLTIQIHPVRYNPVKNKVSVPAEFKVEIKHKQPTKNNVFTQDKYDLVIITPKRFSKQLKKLVQHKNETMGVKTFLKTTEEIYKEYSGVDKPEKIKYFIKDVKEKWNIKYVLLVGGLKSYFLAKRRDDPNQGAKSWHVPVRYNNLFDKPKYPLLSESNLHDPGVISDLYYADIYRYDDEKGYVFENWDPNHDGFFSAWGRPNVENDTGIDLKPDVCVGRLPCRNKLEVKNVVDKIINYENQINPTWFKKMIVVSGDGFLDQKDLDIQWDTNQCPDGRYTIYAQSTNPHGVFGPIETINITVNKSLNTSLTFNHDDHLRIHSYPGPPIAEIVTVTEGDILGKTDYTYIPGEGKAYGNDFNPWANMNYTNGVLHIRGKSYDPEPYGNISSIHVWIKNENGDIIFSEWRNNTEMYYEGEWATGEKPLMGRGGALYYMPDDFTREILWASNGEFTGEKDVIEALDSGCGFAFLSGHGSPSVWADHYPGIPGNRKYGSVTGLRVSNFMLHFPFIQFPLFPMNQLSNNGKTPVMVIGGCHNSQFNITTFSFINYWFYRKGLQDFMGWTYKPTPECFSWWLVRLKNRGAIATLGNTGLGYGIPGKPCTVGGGDAWITIEFFRQYGEKGHDILGETWAQAVTSYVDNFDMTDFEAGHPKTVEQWVLIGDPSLHIGGR